MVEDNVDIKEQNFQFFRSRWATHLGGDGPIKGSEPVNYIFDEENEVLMHPVQGALWSLRKDKALGSDGFPPLLFHQ